VRYAEGASGISRSTRVPRYPPRHERRRVGVSGPGLDAGPGRPARRVLPPAL